MYQSDREGYQGTGRFGARSMLVIVGMLVSVVTVGGIGTSVLNNARDSSGMAAAFAELEANPGTGEIFRVLKVEFPADYALLKQDLEQIALKTRDGDAVARAARDWTAKFRLDNFDSVMRNDRATIRNIFNLTGVANEALAAYDKRLCADVAMGRPVLLPRGMDQAVMQALSASGAAVFRAIKSGRTLPARVQAEPSKADMAAFVKALQAATSPRLFDAIVSPDRLQSVSQDEQCQADLAIHEAVSTMPEPGASTIAAFILRETVKAERAALRQ